MSFTMPYSKLYILTELSKNDVKCISVDRQKLDLSKYIYLWYRKFYICRDTVRFYEHKNDPRTILLRKLENACVSCPKVCYDDYRFYTKTFP